VFKNRAFKMYLGIFLFGQGSVDFILALILYFLTYVIVREGQYTVVMAGVLASQLIAMFIYQAILKKKSKKVPIYIGIPIQMVATIAVVFFAYEDAPILPIVIISSMIGFGTAASTVTPFAILADLADVDELISTQRRPGMYAGMATFSRKIANGLALGLVGVLLWVFGFDSDLDSQASLAIFGITFMFVVLPLIFLSATLYFTKRYPINDETFGVMKEEITRRRNGEGKTTNPDVIATLEAITGYDYNDLWSEKNVDI